MTKTDKTRPADNFHCFNGVGRPYWRAFAEGKVVSDVQSGPMGTSIQLKTEELDGFAIQNGGIERPQEDRMPAGNYYRFFGTITNNRSGAASAMAGAWWLDYENFLKIRSWAEKLDISLSRAAQTLLAIPNEWGDCGYLGRATLTVKLKAWVGKGKPATGSISPDSKMRDPAKDPVTLSPAHLEMKQYFVPGGRDLLGQFFRVEWTKQVLHKGADLS